MFSNLSASSISLATVTPSLVVRGATKLTFPYHIAALRAQRDLHRIGENLDAAQQSLVCVGGKVKRPSEPQNGFLMGTRELRGRGDREVVRAATSPDAHDVALFHDEQLLPVDNRHRGRLLAEQDFVALLELIADELAGSAALAGPYGDDFALLGLLGGRNRGCDATGRLGFAVDALDDHVVLLGRNFMGNGAPAYAVRAWVC